MLTTYILIGCIHHYDNERTNFCRVPFYVFSDRTDKRKTYKKKKHRKAQSRQMMGNMHVAVYLAFQIEYTWKRRTSDDASIRIMSRKSGTEHVKFP